MRAIKITAAALGAVIGTLGSLACVLTRLGVKPEDLRMTGPHWIWLFYAVVLFSLGIAPSIVLMYRSIRGEGQRVKELGLEIVALKKGHKDEIDRLNMSTTGAIKNAEYFAADANAETRELKKKLEEKDGYWTARIKQMHEEIADGYKNETARYAPYKELFTPLQLEAYQLAKDLRAFLDKMGSPPIIPNAKDDDNEKDLSDEEILKRESERADWASAVRAPWVRRVLHTYQAEFAPRVIKIAQLLMAENIPVRGPLLKAPFAF